MDQVSSRSGACVEKFLSENRTFLCLLTVLTSIFTIDILPFLVYRVFA